MTAHVNTTRWPMKQKVIDELIIHYKNTKWNYYPKVPLKTNTGVSDAELHEMMKDGLIERVKGLNDTLIKISEPQMKFYGLDKI